MKNSTLIVGVNMLTLITNIIMKIEGHWAFANLLSDTFNNSDSENTINIRDVSHDFNMHEFINQYNKNFTIELIISSILIIAIGYLFYKHFKEKEIAKENKNIITSNIDESNKHWFEQMQYLSKEITDVINDASRIIHTKVNYLQFYLENKHLPSDQYLKNLTNSGFSKEDLEEIGIDEKYIKENKSKIFPRNIIEKINELKTELKDFKDEHNTNNREVSK